MLLARGVGEGHEAFCEEVAALALGAEAALAPKYEGAQLALGVVMCCLEVPMDP